MSRFVMPLEDVRVATPCPAEWNAMKGDERTRFCRSCEKNVYNLSSMTRREAEALIAAKEGKLCVRFYRRADGTILTQDCPVGLARARRALVAPLKWLAAGAALIITAGACLLDQETFTNEPPRSVTEDSGTSWREVQPFKFIGSLVFSAPASVSLPSEVEITGDISILSPTVPPPPTPPSPSPPVVDMTSIEPKPDTSGTTVSTGEPETPVAPSISPVPSH